MTSDRYAPSMWLAREDLTLPKLPVGAMRAVAVGVPARDEAAHIISCLAALDRAAAQARSQVTVIVGANNCADDTAALARAFMARSVRIEVAEIALPAGRAHAGGARRHVMDRAAEVAGAGGVVMTTDADSKVDIDWIAANLGEIAAGADAVAGMIAFDAAARRRLPNLDHRAAEWRLAALHARLEDLIDPRAHDPWPRHIWAWGASLALTVETYRAIGGVPLVELAEDRALAAAVERAGLRLRRSHAPLVFTSSRRIGRAPGGFADLLVSHTAATAPCDAALEPTRVLVRRLLLRARLRVKTGSRFPTLWATVEATAPRLKRRQLQPADLAREVRQAERLIAAMERAERRDESPAVALAE